MNLTPHKFSREQSEPLHQVLLNFGKGLWQWPLKPKPGMIADISHDILMVQQADNAILHARVRELTIKQLATTLRMRHEHSEEVVMLNSLESLALAGEINFGDFIGRTQNLFPREIELLDITLRVKISSLMM